MLVSVAVGQFAATTAWAIAFERLSLAGNLAAFVAITYVFYFNPDRRHAQFPAHAVLSPAPGQPGVRHFQLGEPVSAAGAVQVPPPDASSVRQRSDRERHHAGPFIHLPVRTKRTSGGIPQILRAQPVPRWRHGARLPGGDAPRPACAVRHGARRDRDRRGDLAGDRLAVDAPRLRADVLCRLVPRAARELLTSTTAPATTGAGLPIR